MLASYEHGFIFLKTKKTASTSLEMAFSVHCGPDDIVSPVGAQWELERNRLGVVPRNFSRDPEIEARYREALASGRQGALRAASMANRETNGCTGHMRASSVKAWVPAEFWDRALKFTSERHPYEKAMSMAHFTYRGTPDDDPQAWRDHLDDVCRRGKFRGFPLYSIDGVSVMDDFIRYDHLVEDAERIAGKLGLAGSIDLPQARTANRTDRTPAAELLTPWQKRRLRRRCADEFELFGWPT